MQAQHYGMEWSALYSEIQYMVLSGIKVSLIYPSYTWMLSYNVYLQITNLFLTLQDEYTLHVRCRKNLSEKVEKRAACECINCIFPTMYVYCVILWYFTSAWLHDYVWFYFLASNISSVLKFYHRTMYYL